jgi:disulfide bond formation protein DsbB
MGCACFGAITAVRQVLLQNTSSDQVQNCWPSLQYMIENLSFWQALRSMFNGTVDCVEVKWTLFDLSLPEWSLLFFLAMLMLGGMQFSRLMLGQRLRIVRP